MNQFTLIILVIIITSCSADKEINETERKSRDSYIDAYYDSHGGSADHVQQNNNDRESKYSPHYDMHLSDHYGPPNGYSAPVPQYGAPVYGPPNYVPSYPGHFPVYGMPHAMLGLLDKFHLKLNIFTILKILLKLVIFKKIVGFIALICLLLFIPKFKMEKEEVDDPDAMKMRSARFQDDERLNNLTSYVINSIEKFSGRTDDSGCKGFNCAIDKISQTIDNKYSYSRLLTMYTEEV